MDPSQNHPHDATQGGGPQPAWLEAIKQRIRSSPNVSGRNPNLTWELNAADVIERQLQRDHHQSWGFVIYRTTYKSDADWAEFLRRLRLQMERAFDYYNGRDILEKFALTVLEDPSAFDGASTDTIRRHFQQWSLTAYPTEQQYQDGVSIGRSPRYHYAVQVDLEALDSVVHDAPAPPAIDTTTKGWVKLIDKSWYLGRGEGIHTHMLHEPVEGVAQEDVGWMRVRYQDVMPDFYALCRGANDWGVLYCRPPKIATA
jgi:hypothetical protein